MCIVHKGASLFHAGKEQDMATLIKIDRNGSKHYEGYCKCDRCSGRGQYWWGAIINGSPQFSGVCYKCGGTGQMYTKWIERTPEYQAKLDAKRAEKYAKAQAEWNAKRAAWEEERRKRKEEQEAKIKAEKAKSQYVGVIGNRIACPCTYVHSAHFDVKSYRGFGTDTMYVHMFKDADGNKLVWKTSSGLPFAEGDSVNVVGTVKEHSEYMDEKQTVLTRCKVTE